MGGGRDSNAVSLSHQGSTPYKLCYGRRSFICAVPAYALPPPTEATVRTQTTLIPVTLTHCLCCCGDRRVVLLISPTALDDKIAKTPSAVLWHLVSLFDPCDTMWSWPMSHSTKHAAMHLSQSVIMLQKQELILNAVKIRSAFPATSLKIFALVSVQGLSTCFTWRDKKCASHTALRVRSLTS